MKKELQTLDKHIRSVNNEFRTVRTALTAAIRALPDNPAANVVSGSPKAYTISSKELLSLDNWTARFHDFKTQYGEICHFIDTLSLEDDIADSLEKVLSDGYIVRGNHRLKLHPGVIKNVQDLLAERNV